MLLAKLFSATAENRSRPLAAVCVAALISLFHQAVETPAAHAASEPAASSAHELAHRFSGATEAEDEPPASRRDIHPTPPADHKSELHELSRRIDEARRRWLGNAPSRHTDRATILLVMQPGRRGIRRFSKSADPILCIDYHCYISRGSSTPARKVRRRKAFGVSNTLGRRAGACSNNTHCIFRNVAMTGGSAVIQPIDLRILRHDRRAPRLVKIDRSCRYRTGRLLCVGGIRTADYAAWIIPEHIADKIGASALKQALWQELPNPAQALLDR